MQTEMFLIIIGTIYVAPSLNVRIRENMAVAFLLAAALVFIARTAGFI